MGAKGKANGQSTTTPAEDAAQLELRTLRGDARDAVIDELKRCKLRPKLGELEQQRVAGRLDSCLRNIIDQITRMVRSDGKPHIVCTVDTVTMKAEKGTSVKLENVTSDGAVDWGKAAGKTFVLSEASATDYLGQKKAAAIMPDQSSLLSDIDKQQAQQDLDRAATPSDSGFKVEKGGKIKPPSAVAAEIGDKLMPAGTPYFDLPKSLVAALRRELARAPIRIETFDENGTPRFRLTLADEWLGLALRGQEWAIVEHGLGDEKRSGEAMTRAQVAHFIKEWVAIGEAIKDKKPPVGPMPAKEEAAATGAE
jgi:hypothetical protein